MTPAGAAQARRRLGDAAVHCYAPYDFPFAVRKFLDGVRPRLLVLVETELWPNLIEAAHRRGIAVALVNARLSQRSARTYGRFPGFTRTLLQRLALIACQYPKHANRFVALGADPAKVQALGSVKFDAVLPPHHEQAAAKLRKALHLQGRRVWIAASTHPGEEGIVLEAHRQVLERMPNACLLLVPRHPVRAAFVKALAERRALQAALLKDDGRAQRSTDGCAAAEVVVVDAMGLLQTLYGLSEAAFIGGSLVPKGGHNPIEAALCAQPLLMGPAVFNFAETTAAFVAADCLAIVKDAPELAQAVLANLEDENRRQAAGRRALQVVEANSGATEKLLGLLRGRL